MFRYVLIISLVVSTDIPAAEPLATPAEVAASKLDLWGEAALRLPGGPTYEFFAGLLPPLRYVDADFLHYPIVLSAPAATVKARLVSNGGAINALARMPNYVTEAGTPVHVRVGAVGDLIGRPVSFDGEAIKFLDFLEAA